MAKFLIECPNCGVGTEASTGLFNLIGKTKRINCAGCGYTINVKTDKMVTRHCENCGNDAIVDQSKGENAVCPFCHEKINTRESRFANTDITCPSCACTLIVDKEGGTTTCPLCGKEIDVQDAIARERARKAGIASVIKFEGDDSTFVWKHPIEDFNLGSQLIVDASQEALFFRDGRALDLFPEGRYTLATQNLPILNELYKLPSNADTPFHSKVYFIDKTVKMAIKWGTPDKVRIKDPLTEVPLLIGASGEMSMYVSDSRKLILKLVGTMAGIKWDSDDGGFAKSIQSSFRPLIQSAVRNALPVVIEENNIDLVFADQYTELMAQKLREKISAGFEEYGITIGEMYCKLLLPEDDPNFKTIKEMHEQNLEKLKYRADSKVRQSKVETDLDEEEFRRTKTAEQQARIRQVEAQQEEAARIAEAQARKNYSMAEEDSEAAIEERRRAKEMEQQKTEIQRETTNAELAKLKAQQKITLGQADSMVKAQDIQLTGLAEAEVQKAKGLAEGATMQAKGYTERDVLQAEVQKEYARSLGQIGSGIGSGGGMNMGMTGNGGGGSMGGMANGIVGDMLGLGVGIATANAVAPQIGTMMQGLSGIGQAVQGNSKPDPTASLASDTWDCSCGNRSITGKFCNACGAKRPDGDKWDCTCGQKGIVGKFCNACGAKKPETWDCSCGQKGISGAFCSACGAKKPSADTWDCACGNKGITAMFCGSCGAKKPAPAPKADTWDCACGNKGITAMFCGSCGAKKPAPAPAPDTWDCACGNKGITAMFCGSCGAKKPAPAPAPDTWDCACGNKGITAMFCGSCGAKKPVPAEDAPAAPAEEEAPAPVEEDIPAAPAPVEEDIPAAPAPIDEAAPAVPAEEEAPAADDVPEVTAEDVPAADEAPAAEEPAPVEEAPAPVEEAPSAWDCECGKTGNTGAFCDDCGKPKP